MTVGELRALLDDMHSDDIVLIACPFGYKNAEQYYEVDGWHMRQVDGSFDTIPTLCLEAELHQTTMELVPEITSTDDE